MMNTKVPCILTHFPFKKKGIFAVAANVFHWPFGLLAESPTNGTFCTIHILWCYFRLKSVSFVVVVKKTACTIQWPEQNDPYS